MSKIKEGKLVVLQVLVLIMLMGMLVFVIVAPFNPPIFFSICLVAVGSGIWAIYILIQINRSNHKEGKVNE